MAVISELAVNVVARTGGVERGLKRAGKAFRSFKNKIASGMAGLMGGSPIAWISSLAGDMQETEVRFETMMGSMSKSKALLDDLDKFAAKTPFQFTELADGAANLMAFGVSSGEVENALKHLGDVASGTPATLEQIVNVFGKVKAKGKASMEEMNRLMEAGIPILDVLASQLGVTKAKVIEMTSGGKIGFDTFKKAVFSMSEEGGDFFNMMEKQSKTLKGALSTLKDNFAKLGREIGTILLPILEMVVGFTLKLVEGWNSLSAGFKKTVVVIISMTAAFAATMKVMLLIKSVTKGITIAQIALNVALAVGQALRGNVVAIAAALAAAAVVGGLMVKTLNDQDDALKQNENQQQKNVAAIGEQLDGVKEVSKEEKKRLDLLKKQEDALKSRAKSIKDSVMTPMEKATRDVQEINTLVAKGFLDSVTAARKKLELQKNLLSATKPDKQADTKRAAIGAAEFRTQAGFSAAQQGQRVFEEMKRIAQRNLDEQRRQSILLAELNRLVNQGSQGLLVTNNLGP